MVTAGDGVGVSERVAQFTLAEWTREISEEITRKLVLLALLKKEGRISYGHSGGETRWPFRVDEHLLTKFSDMNPVSFSRKITKKRAVLPWRAQSGDDAYSLQEILENAGPPAVLQVLEDREGLMAEGLMRQLAANFFADGNAQVAIDAGQWHGIESFMSTGAQVATDLIASVHNDSYASHSTAVGALGGSSFNQRVWTPAVINTGYTPAAGQRKFTDFADQYLRAGIIRSQYGEGGNDGLSIILLTQADYETLLNLLSERERIVVNRGKGEALVSMGFTNLVEIDGVPITWSTEVPATDAAGNVVHGYGFNTAKLELRLLGPKSGRLRTGHMRRNGSLFFSKVDFNVPYQSETIFMVIFGNLVFFSPRRFAKWADLTMVP